MKLRNSSRITALVLALMMIVPLLSIPTFAAPAFVKGDDGHYSVTYDFSSNEGLSGATGGVITAGAYGKDATDSALVMDSTSASVKGARMSFDGGNGVAYKGVGKISSHDHVILQAQYYFPTGTTAAVYGGLSSYQFTNGTETYTGASRLEIYQLYAKGTKVTLTPIAAVGYQATFAPDIKVSDIETNKWFTLSTVIETATGKVKQYVDGVLYNEYQLTNGTNPLSGICVRAFTFSAQFNNDYTTNGNPGVTVSGSYAVDNAMIYTDITKMPGYQAPGEGGGEDGGEDGGEGGGTTDPVEPPVEPEPEPEPTDDRFFEIDYEDKTEGDKATNAQGVSPSSAVYEKFDGDMAIRFDMVAKTGTTVGYEFFTSTHGKVYDASTLVDNPDFNWRTATLTDLTLIGPSDGAATGWIYVARHGDLVHVYTFGSSDNSTQAAGEAITEIGKLGRRGDFPVFAADTDAGAIEAIHGGTNSFVAFKLPTKEFKYDATAGAINTFVLNASYYISADLKGQVNSILGGLDEVYLFNFNTMKFQSSDVKVDLVTNAWNKVTMILTLTEGNTSVDVYLNGSYVATKSKANVTTSGAAWTAMRIARNYSATPNAGTFYLDDVSIKMYDSNKAYDPANGYGVIVGGEYYTNEQKTTKLYGDDVYAINAGIVKTEQKSQIRLSAVPADTATSGIRFATLLDTDQVAILEGYGDLVESVNYGTLIVPIDYYSDENAAAELTFESLKAAGKSFLNVKATPTKFYDGIDNDDSTTHFVGSIVNIKDYNTDRHFTGRGYLEIKLKTGETIMVYSDAWWSVSIKERAEAELLTGQYKEDSPYYPMLTTWATYGDTPSAE